MGPLSVGRNRSRWAGISGGGTVSGTITSLLTVAELTVIGAGCPRQSERAVRLTAFGAVTVFAGIHIPVTAGAGLTESRAKITSLTGWTVVHVVAGVGPFVTGIVCTGNTVVAVHRCPGIAGPRSVTGFITIAKQAVRACRSRRRERTIRLTALAAITILTGIDTSIAAEAAGFTESRAGITSLTGWTVVHVVAGVGPFITGIVRAGDAVVTVHRRPGLAIGQCVARLGSVAEESIIAVCIVGHVVAGVGPFVAGIIGAGHTVVTVYSGPGITGPRSVTGFITVTE